MSSKLPRTMIDSNVIGDWILVSMKKREIENESKNKEEAEKRFNKIWEKYKRAQAAFELLEKIKYSKIHKNFFVCIFSLVEIFQILKDEFVLHKLSKFDLPYKYWMKKSVQEKIKFTKNDEENFVNIIMEFFETFILSKKIILAEMSFGKELNTLIDLILRKRCSPTDAILLLTAIDNDCKFFITLDNDLIRKMKNETKIKVITPQEFLSKFNKAKY